MPDMNDNELRKLFQHAGRPPMGTDLADRIMARVAVTPVHVPLHVKPLIGKAGWFAIAVVFITLLVILMNAVGAGSAGDAPSLLDPMYQWLPNMDGHRIQVPTGQWPFWASTAAGCMLLFTLLDRAMTRIIR